MAMTETTVEYVVAPTKRMSADNTHLLAGLLPDARLKIYPDSAHGFLFQHHSQFAADLVAFLEEAD
jgi:pimeloyl-ACP methyl ester carboxylesterase